MFIPYNLSEKNSFEPAALDDQEGVWFIATPLLFEGFCAYLSANDTCPRGHPLP